MAKVKVLLPGYTNEDSVDAGGEEKTRSTTTLVLDKNIVMVCDPGVLDSQQILIDALRKEGFGIGDVNYVFITHSHVDHYRNIGMFPVAKTLDYWGIWDGESVEDWKENFTEDIKITKTPGHDNTGLTLFVKTNDGIVAICGDVFWKENYPENDEYASDPVKLKQSRAEILKSADFVIPGHAGMYKVKKL